MFEYQLKKSTRRKSVAIKVHNQQVTVYAPHYLNKQQLEGWLQAKKPWVTAQLQKQLTAIDSQQYVFQDKQIRLFNESINLSFAAAATSAVTQQPQGLLITASTRVKHRKQKYQQLLTAYLNEQLTAYIEMRLSYFCAQMQEALPQALKIALYKRKWGSCNSKRELTFNLLLIGAPHSVIDYVIVHELAHLRHLNHSQAFWSRVAQFCPDYKHSQLWLKQHGVSLQWVFR